MLLIAFFTLTVIVSFAVGYVVGSLEQLVDRIMEEYEL